MSPSIPAVLLACLPAAEDAATAEQVLITLVVLGVRDGKVDAGLAAAERPDARVRFRATQGLLPGRDREALLARIALLTDAPLDLAEQAQDPLCGDKVKVDVP